MQSMSLAHAPTRVFSDSAHSVRAAAGEMGRQHGGPALARTVPRAAVVGSLCADGLAEAGDHGWVYTFGGIVFELADGERGWLVSSGADRHGGARWFGDLRRAERVFFRTVADAIVASRPCIGEATIGGAHLVIVRAGGYWHVAEASADSWACAYADEEDARRAWLSRGVELFKQIAGACG